MTTSASGITEVWLIGANIAEYSHGNIQNHEPKRKRKCLLHRREIQKLQTRTQQKGLALVPLQVFFNAKGLAKVTLGLCQHKRQYDKKDKLLKKEEQKKISRLRKEAR